MSSRLQILKAHIAELEGLRTAFLTIRNKSRASERFKEELDKEIEIIDKALPTLYQSLETLKHSKFYTQNMESEMALIEGLPRFRKPK